MESLCVGITEETRDSQAENLETLNSVKSTSLAVEIIKILNVVVSMGAVIYYLIHENVPTVEEYLQILFLSILVLILDTDPGLYRQFWFVMAIGTGVVWATTPIKYVDIVGYPICALINIVDFIAYGGGALACVYVILQNPELGPQKSRYIEMDLLIYLAALNVICTAPVHDFNASLHMLLDIRMTMLIYIGLYRPKDRIELLRNRRFLFILATIVAFILILPYAESCSPLEHLAFLINICMGLTFWWQAWHHMRVVYPAYEASLLIHHQQRSPLS